MQVSVRDLKNHLSRYLHLVKEGEQIIVTSHQVAMARLMPIPDHADPAIQSILQIDGVQWNGKKPTGGKQRPVIKGDKTVSDYVLEGRK